MIKAEDDFVYPIMPIEIVEMVFDEGRECQGCSYERRWTEPHGEHLCQCRILEDESIDPESCPGFDKMAEKVKEDDERPI